MSKEEIAEITQIVAAEVLTQRENVVQEEFDLRFHNVQLLMRNYRKLKAHYSHISPEALEVNVICSMRRKTSLMMSHVDKMLLVYKTLCENSVDQNEASCWQALYLRYISDERMTIDEISEQMRSDRRTFYRYINRAFVDMAVLLFGIEAIGTWKPNKKAAKQRA